MNRFVRFVKSCLYTVNHFSKRMEADNLTAFAAQAAFFIFISVFPFLMLILNLLSYIPIFNGENFSENFTSMLSPQISNIISSIVAEAGESGGGALISITSVAALWASSKGMIGIISGLNSVYKTTEKRGYIWLRIISLLYTLGLIVVLTAVLLLLVFGNRIIDTAIGLIPDLLGISHAVKIIRWLLGVALLLLFFTSMYTVIPERKTRLRNELPGAFISTLGWMGFSALYSFYIDHFGNQSVLYGSLTAIVLLLLWLYFCMIILFFGAEVNDMLRTNDIKSIWKSLRGEKKAINANVKTKK